MSTTTSHTPDSEGQSSQVPGPEPATEGGGAREGGARSTRLIHNEATTEIPVHLLFRDDPEPVSVPLAPAVVGRRRGTGEQPRVRRPVPGRAAPRPVPEIDPELVERPARVLPGAVGVLAGACGMAGCVLTSWWAGVLPPPVTQALGLPGHGGAGLGPAQWAAYAGAGALGLFGFGGLARGRTGRAWVLGLFGRYRGTVRRTGLMWVNPLVLRRRVDVRLRHWRSEPMSAVDANGVALRVVVLVVWRVRDTARATLGVDDHQTYLRECVEAALSRVLSRLPAELPPAVVKDATLRNTEAVGEALTRLVAADTAPVGLEVFSAQPTKIEYAPEVAAVMQRRRIAALDAQHRDTVLTSVVDSVEDTVTRLTMRGLVELDDYERKALVKDLTVAFYTGRSGE
ncbi:SPFH domain-containing protein [Streptomyces sp. NBC_00564]|uniref:SPFH domain-containing protein n=1 Tax=unclassified Streptomyces TaxID=2593676 RepID=UPI00352E0990|nr:SPFH domain-containing protein [Streptomyces sp. NBC_00827]WUC11483.1 SPFH domain-containing protein [Streptomyces sp. NBC_00564]